MKNFLVLACFLCMATRVTAEWTYSGILSAEVQGDTVILKDDSAWRNCGSRFKMTVTFEGDHLVWIQQDTGAIANCNCLFNYSVTVVNLPPGQYQADVFYISQQQTRIPIGTITFVIEDENPYGTVRMADSRQSDCLPYGMDSGEPVSRSLITVYPNPFGEQLKVSVDQRVFINGIRILLFDCFGNKRDDEIAAENPVVIDAGNLPPGLYLIRAVGNDGRIIDTIRTIHEAGPVEPR